MWLAAETNDAVLTTSAIDREPIVLLGGLPRQRGTISCFTQVVAQVETAESQIAELKKPVGQKADRGLTGGPPSRDPGRRRQPAEGVKRWAALFSNWWGSLDVQKESAKSCTELL